MHCTNPVQTQITNNESVQQTTGAEGKALKLYGRPREEHCTNCSSEAKYEKHRYWIKQKQVNVKKPYGSQGKGSKQTGSIAPAKHMRGKVSHPHCTGDWAV